MVRTARDSIGGNLARSFFCRAGNPLSLVVYEDYEAFPYFFPKMLKTSPKKHQRWASFFSHLVPQHFEDSPKKPPKMSQFFSCLPTLDIIPAISNQDKISKLILCDQMASGLIRPSWSLEQRAQYGAHASGEELLKLVSDVADEEQADPRREFLCLGRRYMVLVFWEKDYFLMFFLFWF